MKKIIAFVSLLPVLLLLSGCEFNEKHQSISVDGISYAIHEYQKGDSYYLNDIDIANADLNGLLKLQSDDFSTIKKSKIEDSQQGAIFAIKALNRNYDKWTYTDTVCIGYNVTAKIYYAHGQLESRNDNGKIGIIIFNSDGEIILTRLSSPQ